MANSSDKTAPLNVMVLDDNEERARMVESSLIENGFKVGSVLSSASGLLHQIEQHRPDVIVIDLESPDRDVLESLAIVSSHNPTPIVMFSNNEDPAFMSDALRSGVTAYQGDGIDPATVKPIIDVAMSQFQSFNLLRKELADTRSELEERKLVEKARLLLARHHKVDSDAAHRMIQKISMDTNKRMIEVVQTVIATLDKEVE